MGVAYSPPCCKPLRSLRAAGAYRAPATSSAALRVERVDAFLDFHPARLGHVGSRFGRLLPDLRLLPGEREDGRFGNRDIGGQAEGGNSDSDQIALHGDSPFHELTVVVSSRAVAVPTCSQCRGFV